MMLDRFPRLALGQFPTPLEQLPRLSVALRRSVYIKRDDQVGPALGGNKVRKLEYLLAEAQAQGARRVVTFGGLQSNHARMTAAAARSLGMEPHLFFFERRPRQRTGNLLLNELLGAKLHFIPFGGGNADMTLEQAIRLVRWVARLRIGSHYYIPVGGHSWRGCLGYVRAAIELDEQARATGIGNATLVLAAGTGGTLAGLMAGFAMCGSALRPLAIDVGKLWKRFPESIAALANDLCRRLGAARRFTAAEVPLVAGYVGRRYGEPTAEGLAAMKRLGHMEGILLDPIYTGKAFAGLLHLAETGQLPKGEPLIFLHTGGGPGIFA